MQTPVHIIAGVLIQFIMFFLFPNYEILAFMLTIILAFFSHFFIDAAAILTYHPPKRLKGDRFWLYYHVCVYFCSFILILLLINSYWVGIVAANSVDIYDWLILRPIAQRTNNKKLLPSLGLHKFADKVRNTFFYWAPDFTHSRLATIPEILLYIISITLVLFV